MKACGLKVPWVDVIHQADNTGHGKQDADDSAVHGRSSKSLKTKILVLVVARERNGVTKMKRECLLGVHFWSEKPFVDDILVFGSRMYKLNCVALVTLYYIFGLLMEFERPPQTGRVWCKSSQFARSRLVRLYNVVLFSSVNTHQLSGKVYHKRSPDWHLGRFSPWDSFSGCLILQGAASISTDNFTGK